MLITGTAGLPAAAVLPTPAATMTSTTAASGGFATLLSERRAVAEASEAPAVDSASADGRATTAPGTATATATDAARTQVDPDTAPVDAEDAESATAADPKPPAKLRGARVAPMALAGMRANDASTKALPPGASAADMLRQARAWQARELRDAHEARDAAEQAANADDALSAKFDADAPQPPAAVEDPAAASNPADAPSEPAAALLPPATPAMPPWMVPPLPPVAAAVLPTPPPSGTASATPSTRDFAPRVHGLDIATTALDTETPSQSSAARDPLPGPAAAAALPAQATGVGAASVRQPVDPAVAAPAPQAFAAALHAATLAAEAGRAAALTLPALSARSAEAPEAAGKVEVAAPPAWMASATFDPRPFAAVSTPVVALPTPLDAPEFHAMLGVQISQFAADGVQRAELSLNPAELGPISVRIDMQGDQAQVVFGADLAETRAVIEAGWAELATSLQEAGFTLSGGGVSEHSSQARDRHAADPARPQAPGSLADPAPTGDGTAAPRALPRPLPGAALDVYA